MDTVKNVEGQMMNKGEFADDMKGGHQMGSHMMPNGEMMSNGTEYGYGRYDAKHEC